MDQACSNRTQDLTLVPFVYVQTIKHIDRWFFHDVFSKLNVAFNMHFFHKLFSGYFATKMFLF